MKIQFNHAIHSCLKYAKAKICIDALLIDIELQVLDDTIKMLGVKNKTAQNSEEVYYQLNVFLIFLEYQIAFSCDPRKRWYAHLLIGSIAVIFMTFQVFMAYLIIYKLLK